MDTETPAQGANERTAAKLRSILAERKIKAPAMGDAVGISASSARRRLTGRHQFTLNEVEELAEWLGVGIEQLLPAPPGPDG